MLVCNPQIIANTTSDHVQKTHDILSSTPRLVRRGQSAVSSSTLFLFAYRRTIPTASHMLILDRMCRCCPPAAFSRFWRRPDSPWLADKRSLAMECFLLAHQSTFRLHRQTKACFLQSTYLSRFVNSFFDPSQMLASWSFPQPFFAFHEQGTLAVVCYTLALQSHFGRKMDRQTSCVGKFVVMRLSIVCLIWVGSDQNLHSLKLKMSDHRRAKHPLNTLAHAYVLRRTILELVLFP